MPNRSIFRWRDGLGWLVLSGHTDASAEVRAKAISRIASGGSIAYVTFGPGDDQILNDMQDLGAPAGYWVDVFREDDETLNDLLEQAALIMLPDTLPLEELKPNLTGAAWDGITTAFERGAVILVEGAAASIFGQHICTEQIAEGFGWVDSTVITAIPAFQQVQALLREYQEVISIEIAQGAAIAFGPGGEVESWGNQQVKVTLGERFSSHTT